MTKKETESAVSSPPHTAEDLRGCFNCALFLCKKMPGEPAPDVTPVPVGRSATVSDAIDSRRSVRQFTSQPVPLEVMQRLVQKASRAATGGNIQPWKACVLSAIDTHSDALLVRPCASGFVGIERRRRRRRRRRRARVLVSLPHCLHLGCRRRLACMGWYAQVRPGRGSQAARLRRRFGQDQERCGFCRGRTGVRHLPTRHVRTRGW